VKIASHECMICVNHFVCKTGGQDSLVGRALDYMLKGSGLTTKVPNLSD
jgi:hypothetical protein